MKKLSLNYKSLKLIIINFILVILISKTIYANPISFVIEEYGTDSDAILSLLDIARNKSESINEIIKALNDSNLFSSVN